MIRHQYGISAVIPRTSFAGETSGGSQNVRCFLRLKTSGNKAVEKQNLNKAMSNV